MWGMHVLVQSRDHNPAVREMLGLCFSFSGVPWLRCSCFMRRVKKEKSAACP